MQQLMSYERIWTLPDRPNRLYEKVATKAAAANSLFWYCAWCSTRYAEVHCTGVASTWHGISGCCPNCSGDRFSIPGSIESVYLIRFPPFHPILEYQLSVELSFLNSKDHPHNANRT